MSLPFISLPLRRCSSLCGALTPVLRSDWHCIWKVSHDSPLCPALSTESSEHEDKSTDASGDVPPQSCPPETPTLATTDAPEEEEEEEEEGEAPKSPADSQDNDELGPLPDNWEMAYTEKGEVYFIE